MDWFHLQPASIPALTQVILACVIMVYFLTRKQKSSSTWWLVAIFAGFTGHLVAVFFEISVQAAWQFWLLPVQYIFGVWTLVCMTQFAYTFLKTPYPREAQIVTRAMALVALGISIYLIYVPVTQGSIASISFSGLLGFVLGAGLWAVILFLRKAVHRKDEHPFQWGQLWTHLRQPPTRSARAHRAFAGVFLFLILSALPALLRNAGWLSWAEANTLTSICFLLYFSGFVLVYNNYAPQATTFQIKLVGLILITMLIAISLVSLGLLSEETLGREAVAILGLAPDAALQESRAYRAFVHTKVTPMAWGLLGTTGFILVAFPFFFRFNLVQRLNTLVDGVKRVNAGDLEVQIPSEVRDEIGLLARQFNRMTRSLKAHIDETIELSLKVMEQEQKTQEMVFEQRLLKLENERKSQELEEARQLQLSMRPTVIPAYPGLHIAAQMETATEVGGDYYDFHAGPHGLTIALGDATGHGMKASTLVTATKSLFHSLASTSDLLDLITNASQALKKMNLSGLYMALAVVRFKDYELELVGAGLPAGLLYRAATQQVETIALKGMPLGSFENFPYTKQTVSFAPGDTLVLMTDGFPELFNAEGDMLGYEHARTLLAEIGGAEPETIIRHFTDAGYAWAEGHPQDDDMTFVVLKAQAIT